MDTDIRVTSIVRGNSAETLRRATEVASNLTRPDEEITRTIKTLPGGVERLEKQAFRLGDYFDDVELHSDEPAAFMLVFHVRHGVDSTWKPLFLAVLRAISEGVPGANASIVPPTDSCASSSNGPGTPTASPPSGPQKTGTPD